MKHPDPSLEKLQRWMEEFLLDMKLSLDEQGGEEPWPEIEPPQEGAALESGQIRLWPPLPGEGPFYALIWQEGYERWWVLPFSPYAHPATPEEIKVRSEPPVRVLQGWNPRKLTGGDLRGTWCVDTLSRHTMQRVEHWWARVQSGDVLPAAEDLGPPLVHPMDPRFDYLDSERERANHFLGELKQSYGQQNDSLAAERPDEDDDYRS